MRLLPARPDLDQLRRQAKDLLRKAQAGDCEAAARIRARPSLAADQQPLPEPTRWTVAVPSTLTR
ncbi:hypothetical protein [Actinokineospora sp.]|uniref:hypothetical protein n=1 Tax=Actinokineospora sp. TaxID=1872133 RepID=UPI003D6ABFB9